MLFCLFKCQWPKYMSLCNNVLMSYTVVIWMLKHTFMECLLYEILVIITLLFEYHKYCVLFFFPDQNSVVLLGSSLTLSTTFYERFVQFFHEVFLPQGYPDSVSDDYYRYQLWDTLQVSSLFMWCLNEFSWPKLHGVAHNSWDLAVSASNLYGPCV